MTDPNVHIPRNLRKQNHVSSICVRSIDGGPIAKKVMNEAYSESFPDQREGVYISKAISIEPPVYLPRSKPRYYTLWLDSAEFMPISREP